MKLCKFLLALLSLSVLTACDTIFTYPDNSDEQRTLILDIALDLDIVQVENPQVPSTMSALFFDAYTHDLLESHFVGSTGGEVKIRPGDYDILVYNFGTESTIIRGEKKKHTIEAYTNEAPIETQHIYEAFKAQLAKQKGVRSDYLSAPLVNQPDHLWVDGAQGINVPSVSVSPDDNIRVSLSPQTIVETYRLEIGPVHGVQYIAQAEVFLSGQVESKFFGKGEISDEAATLHMPMYLSKDHTKFINRFNTFGKHPETDSYVYLNILVVDTGGKPFTYEFDITDILNNPPADHVIVVNCEIDIPEPEKVDQGVTPTVSEWEEDNISIDL